MKLTSSEKHRNTASGSASRIILIPLMISLASNYIVRIMENGYTFSSIESSISFTKYFSNKQRKERYKVRKSRDGFGFVKFRVKIMKKSS